MIIPQLTFSFYHWWEFESFQVLLQTFLSIPLEHKEALGGNISRNEITGSEGISKFSYNRNYKSTKPIHYSMRFCPAIPRPLTLKEIQEERQDIAPLSKDHNMVKGSTHERVKRYYNLNLIGHQTEVIDTKCHRTKVTGRREQPGLFPPDNSEESIYIVKHRQGFFEFIPFLISTLQAPKGSVHSLKQLCLSAFDSHPTCRRP